LRVDASALRASGRHLRLITISSRLGAMECAISAAPRWWPGPSPAVHPAVHPAGTCPPTACWPRRRRSRWKPRNSRRRGRSISSEAHFLFLPFLSLALLSLLPPPKTPIPVAFVNGGSSLVSRYTFRARVVRRSAPARASLSTWLHLSADVQTCPRLIPAVALDAFGCMSPEGSHQFVFNCRLASWRRARYARAKL
jgi:hypothetical protein